MVFFFIMGIIVRFFVVDVVGINSYIFLMFKSVRVICDGDVIDFQIWLGYMCVKFIQVVEFDNRGLQ